MKTFLTVNKMNISFSFKVVKIFTIFLLLGFFIWNSIVVFQNFISGKKVTSNEDKTNESLMPPAILVCRELAFTDPMKDIAELEDFLDNTLHLNYSMFNSRQDVVALFNHGVKDKPTVDTLNDTIINATQSIYENHFKVEYIYSYSHGLCYKFLFLKKVRNNCLTNNYDFLLPYFVLFLVCV